MRGARRRFQQKWNSSVTEARFGINEDNTILLSLNDLSKTDGGAADDRSISGICAKKRGRITPSDLWFRSKTKCGPLSAALIDRRACFVSVRYIGRIFLQIERSTCYPRFFPPILTISISFDLWIYSPLDISLLFIDSVVNSTLPLTSLIP